MLKWLKRFYSNLHWQHAGWWAKLLLLALALLKFVPEAILFGLISALVSLASTTYSIAGTMRAKFKHMMDIGGYPVFSVWFWGPLLVVCMILSMLCALSALLFMPFLSASQCDITSKVLLKAKLKWLAWGVALRGLTRNPNKHTQAFLSITSAWCVGKHKKGCSPAINEIVLEVKRTIDLVESNSTLTDDEWKQLARVHNQFAELCCAEGYTSFARQSENRARQINRGLGVADQLLKRP